MSAMDDFTTVTKKPAKAKAPAAETYTFEEWMRYWGFDEFSIGVGAHYGKQGGYRVTVLEKHVGDSEKKQYPKNAHITVGYPSNFSADRKYDEATAKSWFTRFHVTVHTEPSAHVRFTWDLQGTPQAAKPTSEWPSVVLPSSVRALAEQFTHEILETWSQQ